MWGRELRAGLLFVLVSVAAGSAFRGWQRAHQARFDEIVASLVEADAASLSGRGHASRAGPGSAARSDSAGPGTPGSPDFGDSSDAPDAPGFGEPRAASESRAHRGGPARRRSADAPRPASLDVDAASAEELERLPGIGPALAARIVAERAARGPFGGPDGLLRVPGIGPKTLARIRAYLR
jgi:competence ComEA-like helix-hairpin-helix protein